MQAGLGKRQGRHTCGIQYMWHLEQAGLEVGVPGREVNPCGIE